MLIMLVNSTSSVRTSVCMGLCECMCVEAFDSLERSIIELTTVCVYDTAVNLQCLKASRKPENKMLLSFNY